MIVKVIFKIIIYFHLVKITKKKGCLLLKTNSYWVMCKILILKCRRWVEDVFIYFFFLVNGEKVFIIISPFWSRTVFACIQQLHRTKQQPNEYALALRIPIAYFKKVQVLFGWYVFIGCVQYFTWIYGYQGDVWGSKYFIYLVYIWWNK